MSNFDEIFERIKSKKIDSETVKSIMCEDRPDFSGHRVQRTTRQFKDEMQHLEIFA